MQSLCFLFLLYGDHRDLHVLTHSFPTRRSSDLDLPQPEVPTRETISCWPTDRVTPASARWERLAPAMEPTSPNTLPTSVISSTDRKSNTSELQSLMRISYAVFCLKKKKRHTTRQSKSPKRRRRTITDTVE